MRWPVILLATLSATATARAKMVIMDPPLVRTCPRAPSWEAVDKCLRKQGVPTTLRELPGARLIRLEQQEGNLRSDIGIFLYIQRQNQWSLAGLYQNRGADYDVLGFQAITIGKHAGFRIDLGQMFRTAVQPDGVTNVPALLTMRESMYCSGDSWRCSEITTACDVIVRGGAQWSFHGSVSIAENQIHVDGDRRQVGSFCSVPEHEFLGWTQP